jgi:hypothetical protein
MERKIIHLEDSNDNHQCIICCKRNATTRVKIQRLAYDDSIINFYVCGSCLSKMQKDIEVCK